MAGNGRRGSGRRRWRGLLAALTVLAALPATAATAEAAHLRQVGGPGAADSGACVADPCATIGYAIDQSGPGDTVEIAAGNYDETLVVSTPGLTLQGDPAGGTTIGPGSGGIVEQTELTLAGGVDGVTLRDLEVVSRSQAAAAILAAGPEAIDDTTLDRVEVTGIGPSTPPTTVANGLEITAPGAGWQILDSSFADNYLGVAVSSDLEDVTVDGSTFDGNREGFYVQRTLPLTPASSGEIVGLRMSDSSFDANEYGGLYFEGLSDALIEGVAVTGTGRGVSSLPSGARALVVNLKAGDAGEITIADSSFTGSVNEGILVQARGWAGDLPAYEAAPATLASFHLRGSTLSGNGGPGLIVNNRSTLGSTTIEGNRIVGNGTAGYQVLAPVSGIFARNEGLAPAPVLAADNWFGCNAGPLVADPACDGVNPPVAAAPWLVLTGGAVRQQLRPGDDTTVRAAIETNSAGQHAGPAPDGVPVSFSAGSGSLFPAVAGLVGGRASATFAAAAPGDPGLAVTVDNQRLAVPLDVVAPPAPREDPPRHEEGHPAPPPAAPQPPPVSVAPSGNGAAKVVAANGAVPVATVGCAAASCEVEAAKPTLKVGGQSFAVKVKLPRQVAGGESAPVRVVLPKAAREALAESGKGRLRLRVTVTAPDGSSKTVTVTVVLKAKRHQHS